MKILISSLVGLEDVSISEIKSILGVRGRKVCCGRVVFNADKIDKYLKKARTIIRVCCLIKKFKFKNMEDILCEIDKMKFDLKGSFMIRCKREGKHNFKSNQIEKEAGAIVFKKGYKTDVRDPENIVFVDIVDDFCFVGYLVKDKLCKRDYRFRRNNDSIDCCLAASLARIGDIEKKHVVVNPLCKDAVIGIELYLQGIKKVYCLDGSKNNIGNSKINTKLAKVRIGFNNFGVGWMDTLFKEKSVDRIISMVSYSSRKKNLVIRDFAEIFNQAIYILKKNGKIIFVGRKLSKLKSTLHVCDFVVEKEKKVSVGKENYDILVMKRN